MDLEGMNMVILVVLSEALGWTKFFLFPLHGRPLHQVITVHFHFMDNGFYAMIFHDYGLFIAGASHDKSYQVYSILIFVSSF